MGAIWLLTILTLSICLRISAQELQNTTDNVTDPEVETAGRGVGYWRSGTYYRAPTNYRAPSKPNPPQTPTTLRQTTWTRKCSGIYALGCAQCSFWTAQCTQCKSPNYVLGTNGQCKCARGYYNPYIGKQKVAKSSANSGFYDNSYCAPCPSGSQCSGGAYSEAVRQPKSCSTKGYQRGWNKDCSCERGFTEYKGACGKLWHLCY